MKSGVIISLLFLVLVSCQYESYTPVAPESRPLKASYYKFDTGEKIAEGIYQYTDDGKLAYESYTDLVDHNSDHETFYEYNADGNLIKTKASIWGDKDKFQLTFYTYVDGLKIQDSSFFETSPQWWTRNEYFYNQNGVLDSLQVYGPTLGRDDVYLQTTIYSYNDAGKVSLESVRTYVSDEIVPLIQYSYDGDNLVSTCREGNCWLNEYNERGQVTKSSLTLGNVNRLTEENFYRTDGRLDEKRMYHYDAYDLNAPYNRVTQVKYEY